MDYACAELELRETYDRTAGKYRQDDEREIQTPDHADLRHRLERITSSFQGPIDVLEVGCGTGRYFHCLRKVRNLVGVDVSNEMLQAAREPVLSQEISAEEIKLVCGNVYREDFAPGSFDFIYALGVFGNGCGVTENLCQKFFSWLKPGGCLFFDAFDIAAEPLRFRIRQRSRVALRRIIPEVVRKQLRGSKTSVPFFILSRAELDRLVSRVFPAVRVRSKACRTVAGEGRKLQCLAMKAEDIPPALIQGFV